jgi:hypothetical protein
MWIIDALPTHLIPFPHDDDHDRVRACAYHSQANNLSLGSQTNGECSVERERESVYVEYQLINRNTVLLLAFLVSFCMHG